jgi:hypothetical protein
MSAFRPKPRLKGIDMRAVAVAYDMRKIHRMAANGTPPDTARAILTNARNLRRAKREAP